MPSRTKERRLTERRLASSHDLDRLSALEIVRLMNREDRSVPLAIQPELAKIARAVELIVDAIEAGGRLIYLGAGSSGRLGILDASELPPTFGLSTRTVRALIAGGRRAVTDAIEGAEDFRSNGARDLKRLKLSAKDVVVGIMASGTTPYVLGALAYAKKLGATTIALTSNRNPSLNRVAKIVIAPQTGAEVLTGSTRLKAGTAQKLVLNMLSTAVMVRLGHAYENLMIDVRCTNKKVSDRILRILADASGAELSVAQHALRQSGHNLRVALVMLKKNLSATQAKQLLKKSSGHLRRALGE